MTDGQIMAKSNTATVTTTVTTTITTTEAG